MPHNTGNMHLTPDFKRQFQELLRTRIKKKKDWVNELAELLHCSNDAVYKKSRLDSFYTVDELVILAKYYSISLDSIILGNKDDVVFSVPNMAEPVRTIDNYLNRLQDTFLNLEHYHDVKIYYASRELPVFYYFLDQRLAAFKMYIFARNIWKLPGFVDQKYTAECFSDYLYHRMFCIWQKYASLNSYEYWNSNILDNTLQQILFYNECGELDSKNANRILDGMENVLLQIKSMAANSSKNDLSENFYLFENKILHTSNHVLVKSKEKNIIYITFDNPNFIYTDNGNFIEYSENWYSTIKEISYALGAGSGHNTLSFFNYLISKIDVARKRILHNENTDPNLADQ